MEKNVQPILAFITCVTVMVGGLGLAGFMGTWPVWPTVVPILTVAAIAGLLVGRPVERAINAFTAVLASGLALGGVYLYCRGEQSVNVVELLIPATVAIVCAVVVGDLLRRVERQFAR